MRDLFKKRKEFNTAFGIVSNDSFGSVPPKVFNLEHKMMKEELDEYLDACKENNLVEILDAITDQLYLLVGCAYNHGITPEMLEDAYNEVHRSNMSKLGSDGKPIYREDKKILKGINYFKPNLEQFVK